MARKHRKIRKKRGSRTCGGGSHKKSRGAGNRGGSGMAGSHKGKWTYIIKKYPDYFGRRGFTIPEEVKHTYNTINVGELDEIADELVERGLAKREKDRIYIQTSKLDVEKVLGKGKVTKPLFITAQSFSESAIRKIEGSGGKAILERANSE
jgi:large subunit ribosomal protein L15